MRMGEIREKPFRGSFAAMAAGGLSLSRSRRREHKPIWTAPISPLQEVVQQEISGRFVSGTMTPVRKGGNGRKRLRLILVVIFISGCRAPAPETTTAPRFPGYPHIPRYGGSQCKNVLLVGDSLLTPVQDVADVLRQSGRCNTTINAAVKGTAPTGNLQGVHWPTRLQQYVNDFHPDIVVIEFAGNGFAEATDDSAWLSELENGLQNSVNIALQTGVNYVAIAPMPALATDNLAWIGRFLSWQRTAPIPSAKKIDLNPYLAPGNQYSEYLDFGPDGVQKVRGDLLHLNDLGAWIAGYVIAANIAPGWR